VNNYNIRTVPSYLGGSLLRTSDVDVRCRLRSANTAILVVPSTVHQTFNTRWPCLPSGFGTCVEQPAVVCQECTVADDVPSRAEDCTFTVVVWQWLGDRDCTAQYNCCLPATTDCRRFYLFWFCTVPLQCPWYDSVTLISTCYLLTYPMLITLLTAHLLRCRFSVAVAHWTRST